MARRGPLEPNDEGSSPSLPAGTRREIILLRTKLEVRTWFLRCSIALNAGLISGLVVWVVTKSS